MVYFYKSITISRIKKLFSAVMTLKCLRFIGHIGRFVTFFCLLTFLIIPLQSSFMSIQLRKKILRKEIKRKIIAGLHDDELVKLKFANSEIQNKLRWKHSKEFEFNGEMYDIVKTKKTADSIEYYCWWDSEESKLNRKLIALVVRAFPDLPENKELNFQLSNFYKSIFFESTCALKIQKDKNLLFTCNTASFFYLSNRILAGFNSINSPPPNIF